MTNPREAHDKKAQRPVLEEKPFDFIERTKPEDRIEGDAFRGQLTRDNVNPNIPSAERQSPDDRNIMINEPPGNTKQERALPKGELDKRLPGYDPRNPNAMVRGETTGPNPEPPPEHPEALDNMGTTRPIHSINEPPGSDIIPAEVKAAAEHAQQPPQRGPEGTHEADHDALPSHAELERMTRAELDELAQKRSVDISDASNKQDVIDALQKDERKRKRERQGH